MLKKQEEEKLNKKKIGSAQFSVGSIQHSQLFIQPSTKSAAK